MSTSSTETSNKGAKPVEDTKEQVYSVETCETKLGEMLRNGTVKQLVEAINDRNVAFGERPLVLKCLDCSQHCGTFVRAFFSAPNLKDKTTEEYKPQITVCADKLGKDDDLREVLTHELTHAFDHCVTRRDLTTCQGLACSEIRAAREAECRENFGEGIGEVCSLVGIQPQLNDIEPGPIHDLCRWFKKRCVRSYALSSTCAVFKEDGKNCVKEVFEECFADHEPFKMRKS